jgi:hypothetical protein
MKIHKYRELDDGGADLEVELDAEEARLLIEVGLIKVLRDSAEEYEKTQSSVGDKDHWINRMDEDE